MHLASLHYSSQLVIMFSVQYEPLNNSVVEIIGIVAVYLCFYQCLWIPDVPDMGLDAQSKQAVLVVPSV